MSGTELASSAGQLITHMQNYPAWKNDDGIKYVLYYLWPVVIIIFFIQKCQKLFARSDEYWKLTWGLVGVSVAEDKQGGERCQGGGPVKHQTFKTHAYTTLQLP